MIKFSPGTLNQYVQEVDEPVVPVEPTPVHSEEEEQVEELILCPTKQNHFEQWLGQEELVCFVQLEFRVNTSLIVWYPVVPRRIPK